MIKYSSIICKDCTRFPRHMTKREFINKYDIIIYAFFLLIQRFREEDNLFAAQCIWWLASIIQYTEVLTYYFDY